ncbi:putative disease resistance protein At3g14460 [Eucalyptus grandis]|uniref:putative disease resistance protein At3g14460 n=1 Tax=Eucalyptus grandis TaxID=71139 RepID=UPI00192EADF9|nr:putative disease resistance protein At3g14460 [Eucalyptus grandis]XP_039162035.1 putative disease resistance protein At3g14460 [Eucalyptus grandis]XP_039162036.1 putative disease resistance protein At3g14460 [Eucalyptus grandis]XP_039162037.1 putative disease resistance protein At3g14460 [Eucalyptus grandis]XP_039162038.1 putative disease resistance protein At3g14460 [Eucalyptus grandis]XP_039162039.1 putative disease resistance protein At3g14460 [Eucalyptus grandis]XP_039162040.1 putative
MPLGINNLENLTILSKFVVGTKKGLQLKELENLLHLQGELCISELQNVKEVRDCVDAKLLGKEGLSNLFLQWDKDFGNLWNDKHYFQVLNFLQPHTNLENLTILYYGGAKFPPWLNHPSYSKIVSLCLQSCPNVTSLPSLGQLPSLRELSFEGLDAVSIIGSEFYGGKKPFSSLTTLKFKEMLAWKDWSPYARAPKEEVPFSCLEHLVVRGCPSLVGTLPCQLDHLIKLEIHSCQQLNNSTSELCLPSLEELHLEDCSKEILKSLFKLTSLTILKINKLIELVSFDHRFMSCLGKLRKLHIGLCDKLTCLWQDGDETQNLTCLQELVIKNCPQFTSFVAGDGEIELPCNLERMELVDCTSLEKLPSKMHPLKHLVIKNCPKIMALNIPQGDLSSNNSISQLESLKIHHYDSPISFSFAKGRLAPLKALHIDNCEGVESLEGIAVESLETMTIGKCQNLGSLPQCLHMLSYLTRLNIHNCPALEIEDLPPLPATLSSLDLNNCSKIKSIANCNIAKCNNLTELLIWECLVLEIEDFPPLPITLQSLELWDCPMIKSLPNKWHHLTSLQKLIIFYCQNIKCFPKGGLPPKLRVLGITRLVGLKQPVREWGLPLLTSLESLAVAFNMEGEGEKEWFPLEDKDAWSLFPSSLTYLWIYDLRNTERLSSGLRNHLSSLQWLSIRDCPKLRYFPEDGFPPSLQRLWIHRCEILKERCVKLTGDYWPLIQEIPDVDIR